MKLKPSIDDFDCCSLLRWVPGRCYSRGLTPGRLIQLGEFLAQLHNHGETYTARLTFPAERVAYTPEFEQWINIDMEHPEWFSQDEKLILRKAAYRARSALRTYSEMQKDFGLIHGDFHLANYVFYRGQAGAFDFDDCGWGHYLQDIAAALAYVKHPVFWSGRDSGEYAALEQAFVKGYGGFRKMPEQWEEHLPIFITARLFVSLDWLTYTGHK